MTGHRVLVVDDDPHIARALQINLKARGWDVTTAADGATALHLAETTRPDVVVLDLGLPDMDGLEVIGLLRSRTPAPVVVLSARQLGEDKVDALDRGADDYVTKPFGMDELAARLRVAVRRAAPGQDATVVDAGDLRVDLGGKRVFRDGAEVRLTPTEWAMLEVLVRNRGRLVAGPQLLHEVWGPAYRTESNYLRVYAAQLRRKLEADPAHPVHLITQPGRGYVFEPGPAGDARSVR
ncbi:response regulator [Sanguibacter suaedae]|uniref:Response regulator transcription factor n=1 Tax=Sanguibacter suaedae TaxID=2795737 RepID=A0A934M8L3_9MICO|nr:response regulator transcription factor [Sanguibacter suaedae]MBI9113680.1 response regulator transcription factor [Sanguibacter suaedae]